MSRVGCGDKGVACDLIDAIVLDRGILVALAQVFIDESGTHEGSPCMCIGGLIFKKRKATEFSRRWRAILKAKRVPYFRMADVTHPQQGPFKGWPAEALIDLEKKLIGLLGQFAEHGFALSFSEGDFDEVISKEFWGIPAQEILGYSYTYCLRRALTAVGHWIQQSSFEGKVSYFFEAGHMHQANAHRILTDELACKPTLSDLQVPLSLDYKYAAHAFVQKADFPPIQGADLVAWLWRSSSLKLVERQERTPRPNGLAESSSVIYVAYEQGETSEAERPLQYSS